MLPTDLRTIQSSNNCLVFFKDGVKVGEQPYAAKAHLIISRLNVTDANVIFRFGRISHENGTGISFRVYVKSQKGKWKLVQNHFSENEKNDFKSIYLHSLTANKTKVSRKKRVSPNEPGGNLGLALAPTVRFNKENKVNWGVYVGIFRDGPNRYRHKAYFSGTVSPQNVWVNFTKKPELLPAFAGISVRLEGVVGDQTYLRYTIKAFEPSLKFVRYDGRCTMTLTIDEAKPWESAAAAAESMLEIFCNWMDLKNKNF